MPAAEAERIAAEHYGIVATRAPASRREGRQLRAGRPASDAWLLKIVHPDEPADVTNLATAAMLALEGVADLPVQRVIPTTAGEAELVVRTADGADRRARMTSFIDGRILRGVPTSAPLRENLGRVLARWARSCGTSAPGREPSAALGPLAGRSESGCSSTISTRPTAASCSSTASSASRRRSARGSRACAAR